MTLVALAACFPVVLLLAFVMPNNKLGYVLSIHH